MCQVGGETTATLSQMPLHMMTIVAVDAADFVGRVTTIGEQQIEVVSV